MPKKGEKWGCGESVCQPQRLQPELSARLDARGARGAQGDVGAAGAGAQAAEGQPQPACRFFPWRSA